MVKEALKAYGSRDELEELSIFARFADVTVDAVAEEGRDEVALESAEGIITGMNSIIRFIKRLKQITLSKNSDYDDSQVDQWIEFVSNELFHINGETAAAISQREKALLVLENHLSNRTFLVGQRISFADIFVALRLRKVAISADEKPSLCRFVGTISNQKFFKPKILDVVNEPDNLAIQKLKELGIPNMTYAHPIAMTVDEQMAAIGHLEGEKTKNLFLRDKKHGMFLVTLAHDTKIPDTKAIANMLKLPAGANLRFADAPTLLEVLGVTPGSVGPLALVNDTERKAAFVLDKRLTEGKIINSHPLRNDRTTAISANDMLSYVRATNHEPIILDFSSIPVKEVLEKNGGAQKAQQPSAKGPKAARGALDKQKHTRSSDSKKEGHKDTLLAIDRSKREDFAGWYQQVITYSEMIDYYDISGCYILRPWAFEIWEHIQHWFDAEIKELGVSNSYFPLFVSKKVSIAPERRCGLASYPVLRQALETEKDHVEGFAPEVAWVTRSGSTDLVEPIAVRPTSETIMYPAYARWIRSHRDLPLCLNQWSNVVRWEFKDPTPFLRSREFLWQEGHTVHATYEEAEKMVFDILDLYARIYEELLAVPVIKGVKTELEKFAGGKRTTTVEAYITGSGRAIQGATSHNLGTNFGKMFNIKFEDKEGNTQIPWQTSWGITTRSIGVCVMCHGDDQGLVLPPKVAPIQVVIVPIVSKKMDVEELDAYVGKVLDQLKTLRIRAKYDSRDNYTSGWKYNHWEQKGVPVRLEVGPRDVEKGQVVAARRDTGEKTDLSIEGLGETVSALLDDVQANLLRRATESRNEHLSHVREWKDFVPALNRNDIVLTPFCNEDEWEERVKAMSREEALCGGSEDARSSTSVAAKTLCIPLNQPDLPEGTKCFVSGLPAKCWVLWGRSY